MTTPAAVSPGPDVPLAIDALAPLRDGCYEDAMVTVVRTRRGAPGSGTTRIAGGGLVSTPHFDVWHDDGLVVGHRVPDDRIDNSLTALLESELFGPGWVSGNHVFERVFTGVVRTSRPEAVEAWSLFYRNSRRLLAHAMRDPAAARTDAVTADFAAIYDRADALVPRFASVLEVGSCFGFLALHLARVDARRVVATDVSAGTMRLLSTVSAHLGVPLETAVADAARLPRPDRSVDVVLVPHLLEHLDAAHGLRALDEAMRVADRRVVVAVPYEEEATVAYGHVRTIDRADLVAWGRRAAGWRWRVEDHHGGWLVLDRET